MSDKDNNRFNELQKLIEEREAKGESITMLVREQIALLQEAHDDFLKNAVEMGYSLSSPQIGDIEVAQYAAMKQLAEKIGDPIEEYVEQIKSVRIRIFGEANYKRFFEQ